MGKAAEPLQLMARDTEDLSVLSSLCQDALCPATDMAYLRDEACFILALNRFCWEQKREAPPYTRTHAGLRFDNVTDVKSKGMPAAKGDKILCLLSIAYAEQTVVLSFSGDAAIRLTVDSLQAALSDLGDPWPTQWQPKHNPDAY